MAKGEYRPGRHLVVCDTSGEEVWDDEVRRQWNGLLVRKQSWDPQHPQERIRVRPERGAVFPTRPVPDPVYLSTVFDYIILENSPDDEFWLIVNESDTLIALES